MQVIEAQRASILEPHDHLHISHDRAFAADRGHAQIGQFWRRLSSAPGGRCAAVAGGGVAWQLGRVACLGCGERASREEFGQRLFMRRTWLGRAGGRDQPRW
jgi:hypothetical protein